MTSTGTAKASQSRRVIFRMTSNVALSPDCRQRGVCRWTASRIKILQARHSASGDRHRVARRLAGVGIGHSRHMEGVDDLLLGQPLLARPKREVFSKVRIYRFVRPRETIGKAQPTLLIYGQSLHYCPHLVLKRRPAFILPAMIESLQRSLLDRLRQMHMPVECSNNLMGSGPQRTLVDLLDDRICVRLIRRHNWANRLKRNDGKGAWPATGPSRDSSGWISAYRSASVRPYRPTRANRGLQLHERYR